MKRMKLTEAQYAELGRLADKPQPCFGSQRVRVQNNLVLLGLAVYRKEDGTVLDGVCDDLGFRHVADECAITDAGRAALRGEPIPPPGQRARRLGSGRRRSQDWEH